MDDGGVPITGLDELESHLQVLLQSPDAVLEEGLFDEVGLQLTGMSSDRGLLWSCVVGMF